ncbi:hypothetical protein [Frankia sp. Cj3]|uniref:hypothetical protein n=1 Tax=Frankia sp. Cj3 TaxID=2880976 RepID=UPI001EF589E3|nr:hypothetical protein [Frankia sp. Cj3]
MDELIDGAVGVLAAIVFVLVAPVLAIYFAVKAVVWAWSNYWPYAVGGIGFVVLVASLVVAFKMYGDLWVIRAHKRRALRQLDIAFQEAAERMEDIAAQHPNYIEGEVTHGQLPAAGEVQQWPG